MYFSSASIHGKLRSFPHTFGIIQSEPQTPSLSVCARVRTGKCSELTKSISLYRLVMSSMTLATGGKRCCRESMLRSHHFALPDGLFTV
jgi:hypothetical protein